MDFKMKYLHSTAAKGITYWYYRRNGLRIPIKAKPGTPAFMVAYSDIHGSFEVTRDKSTPGTLDFVCEKYLASPEYRQLSEGSKKNYSLRVDKLRKKHGARKIKEIRIGFVKALQSELQDMPGKANAYTTLLNILLNFAAANEWIPFNPIARKIKPLKIGEGWQPWPEDELVRFEKAAGRTPLLAFRLALYTGQREGDIVKMRWSDVQDGMIRVKQQKTGADLFIPVHPKLKPALDEAKRASTGLTILQKRTGAPYALAGFKTVWNDEKIRLGLKHVFHGLRKNATVALFETGCTPQEVQAITGHETLSMVQHYGKGANQKRLATTAMEKWQTK